MNLVMFILIILELIESIYSYKDTRNLKCAEFKNKLEVDTLIHVPCQLIRLMEYLKTCPLEKYYETFLSIQCNDECISGSIKKKFNTLKARFDAYGSKSLDFISTRETKKAEKLNELLVSLPSNITSKRSREFSCLTYSYGLRIYLESKQEVQSIRRNFALQKQVDRSLPIDEETMLNALNKIKCYKQIKSDEFYFSYLKYMLDSMRQLQNNTSKGYNNRKNQLKILTNDDLVQLFYPYVEMTKKFNRILPSHSYLGFLLKNFDKAFDNNCDKQKISQGDTEKPNSDASDNLDNSTE